MKPKACIYLIFDNRADILMSLDLLISFPPSGMTLSCQDVYNMNKDFSEISVVSASV